MNYIFNNVKVKTVEEFYQKVEIGYFFNRIIIDQSKESSLLKFFESKADSVVGQRCIACCYYFGKGASKDYHKAAYWWLQAAKKIMHLHNIN